MNSSYGISVDEAVVCRKLHEMGFSEGQQRAQPSPRLHVPSGGSGGHSDLLADNLNHRSGSPGPDASQRSTSPSRQPGTVSSSQHSRPPSVNERRSVTPSRDSGSQKGQRAATPSRETSQQRAQTPSRHGDTKREDTPSRQTVQQPSQERIKAS